MNEILLDEKLHLGQRAKMISQIKERLEIEFLKRGIVTKITKIEINISRTREVNITVITENFQTTPVIFKELWLQSFGGSMNLKEIKRWEDGSIFEYIEVHIPISFSYRHFGGGGYNNCDFGTFVYKVELEQGTIFN